MIWFEIFRQIIRIRFTFHQSKSLKTSTFIYRKYQYYVIWTFKGVSKFFSRSCWCSPYLEFLWNQQTFCTKALHHKKSSSAFHDWPGIFNYHFNFPCHLLTIAAEVMMITPYLNIISFDLYLLSDMTSDIVPPPKDILID